MKLQDVLNKTTLFFKANDYSSPKLDAELLISEALGMRRIDLYLHFEKPLNDQELQACRDLIRRRKAGEPVAYILGRRGFFEHDFLVGPGVLIPRPETECLVEKALELFKGDAPETFVDLGCGSGCLGLSLLKKFPDSYLYAVDISDAAIEYTEKNAEQLRVLERVKVMKASALDVLDVPEVDLIVSNPPYIAKDDIHVEENVKKYEPEEALFSDEDGWHHSLGFAKRAAEKLTPGGYYIFEHGATQQKDFLKQLEATGQWSALEGYKDLAGLDRFIVARKS